MHLAASLSLGAAAATADHLRRHRAGGALASARAQVGLIAGAFTYLIVTLGLAVLTLSLHRDASPTQIAVRALHAKLPMFVGNVLVGLLSLFALINEPLLAARPAALAVAAAADLPLPPARRGGTPDLAGVRPRHPRPSAAPPSCAVAAAGLRGALDVFGARRVEIEVLRRGGSPRRRYAADGAAAGPRPGRRCPAL